MRILLVEDEEQLAELVRDHLARQSFAVDVVNTLDDAESALATTNFDLMVLDLNLPDGDGLELLRRLRRKGDHVPVLAATARDSLDQRVAGLDTGVDDYLVKPFDLRELTARIRALLRRPGAAFGVRLLAGNIALDTVTQAVEIAGASVILSRRQLVLLETLMRAQGRVVARPAIEEHMYGIDDLIESNAIEAHISRLRKILGDCGASHIIHTVRGVGYMLTEERP